jgi:hypothetical protein
MMVGSSVGHAIIKGNVYAALREQLGDGPPQPYVDGPKVVTSTAVMYPDVVVSGREPSPQDDTIPKPVLVVEVLSSSTVFRPDRSKRMPRGAVCEERGRLDFHRPRSNRRSACHAGAEGPALPSRRVSTRLGR